MQGKNLLKNLFKKIQSNQNDYTSEELKVIKRYEDKEVLQKQGDFYVLNSKYKIATVKIEKNLAILKDLISEYKDIKIDFENLNGAYNDDLVLAKRIFNPRGKSKAKIVEVIEAKSSEILVYVKDNSFFTLKENILLTSKKVKEYKENDVLICDSKSFELVKKIGNLNDAKIDEFISLYLYNENYRLEKSLSINALMNDENKRVDLRDLPFCTIDPNSAKDHDDAIYFDEKEKVLYVAIADVSYFVKEGTPLDLQAYKKSTSIYLPSHVLPMLPKTLSEDMCSLKEGVDRYAYVFKIYLNIEEKEVIKSELFEAIINSHKKYSYGRIDRVIQGHFDQVDNMDKEIFKYLLPLYEITKSYRKNRLKTGYDFRSSENRLILKNYQLESMQTENSTPSHQLIEECMLLANIEASKKVNNVGIYRIHEEPSLKAISKLVDDVNILGLDVKLKKDVHSTITHIQEKAKFTGLEEEIDELIIQSQTQAKYSSKNSGHFGLGFKSYSHFTSPIRRYSDLVIHRILKTKRTPKNIDEICDYISENERKIDQLVWDFEDRKYARWASKNIGKELKVKILDTQKARAVCYDKMIGLKVNLDNYKGQKLFSKLKVKIKCVNIVTKVIEASIV